MENIIPRPSTALSHVIDPSPDVDTRLWDARFAAGLDGEDRAAGYAETIGLSDTVLELEAEYRSKYGHTAPRSATELLTLRAKHRSCVAEMAR